MRSTPRGWSRSRSSFARNELVLAVPRTARDHGPRGPRASPGVDDRDRARRPVPVGAYTRKVLGAAAGGADARRSSRNVRSDEPDVAGVVGKVAAGRGRRGLRLRHRRRGGRRQAEGDRAARRLAAAGRLRRRGGQGRRSTPARRRRSSTGCSAARGGRRCDARDSRRRRDRRPGSPRCWASRSPSRWRSSSLPVVGDLRRRSAPRELLAPRRLRAPLDALRLSSSADALARSR